MIPTLLLTKTFGSRVADGVYESLLDGLELEELWLIEKVKVLHYLMVDDKFTWWDCGRSYLCRICFTWAMWMRSSSGDRCFRRFPKVVKTWPTIMTPA
jgi:hypothetical protein